MRELENIVWHCTPLNNHIARIALKNGYVISLVRKGEVYSIKYFKLNDTLVTDPVEWISWKQVCLFVGGLK